MNFTDLFIKKPVLAVVVSLLILVLGLKAIGTLNVREYPKTENATVTVTTAYYGADAKTIAGFITQPLEQAIAQAQGIDYLSSSSVAGVSTITAHLRLNYDANRALTEINTQINTVKNQLPPEAQQPVLNIQIGQTVDAMYLGFFSKVLANNQITDYLVREVVPKLDAIQGIQTAELRGPRQFAMRAWLNPAKMAAYGVTAADVRNALAANNSLTAVGKTRGQAVTVDLTADSDLHTVQQFKQLAIKHAGNAIVRLKDVARVELGAENYNSSVAMDGKRSVFIGIKVAPDANLLDVAKRVRAIFPEIKSQLPAGLSGRIQFDSTQFVNSSINEVAKTLIEALLIVTVVIFLFIGSLRAVIIPLVAMPLSLIGTFFAMQALGYSINLLTLLALVLAIGLVVDDAIIVVENVDRHMREEHKTPMQCALLAARELGSPIIAMTIVLIAVYAPIGFQKGLTGALFTQFAFTLAAAVTVSAIIALTLSPMMTSRFFKPGQDNGRFVRFVDHQFDRLQHGYKRLLHSVLSTKSVVIVMAALLLLATIALAKTSKSELAPKEDQGVVLGQVTGPPDVTPEQLEVYTNQMYKTASKLPEYEHMFQMNGVPNENEGFTGVMLKPWDQRNRSAGQIQKVLQAKWDRIAGVKVAAFQFPTLPGSKGLPIQVVITTSEPFQNLYEVANKVVSEAKASGNFYFINSDLKIDKPQATIKLNRDMIASLGLTERDVGASLSAALGGNYVNYFSVAGHSYRVIPQVQQVDRLNPHQVLDFYIHTPDGRLVKASTVAHISHEVVPRSLNHFQQLNSATISGVSGLSQGQALDYLKGLVKKVAPSGYQINYSGESRQFVKESGGFVEILLFAVIIVFLALAAQFNSLRDPIVILVSVPLAMFGAMIFVNLFASLNIYTEVGLVTLMGLISKHGILMVEFANHSQLNGMRKREAIEHAAAVRLRPILMTTAAMVLGVIPLVIATGAGAAGRFNMGLVISTGMAIGTLFTLFVVPAFYMLLSTDHHADTPENDGGEPVRA